MGDELVAKIPNGLNTALYSSSLNSLRLLHVIFAKIDYMIYMVQDDKNIEISAQEWGNIFQLKNPWSSLQDGAFKLKSTVFKFRFDLTKEYKMIKEMEYDEGVLTLSLNTDFLTAAMRDEDGEMNPILDLLYGTA